MQGNDPFVSFVVKTDAITSAFLSAFLDVLTVIAVIISAAYGFYEVYHRHVSGQPGKEGRDWKIDKHIEDRRGGELKDFRGFLATCLMY